MVISNMVFLTSAGLKDFINYLDNWQRPSDGSDNPIVNAYVKASPACSEFFQIGDDERSDFDVLKKVILTFFLVFTN
jgi:hypothetical protein